MPTEIQSAYGGLLSSFVNALWSLVDPHEMTIDPDAVEMLLDFHDEIEPRLAKEGDLRPLGGFVGKIVGSAARFAALHHLGWYGPRGLPLPITVGSVARSIKLARYAIEHYRYVMAATGFVTEIAIAERIVRWCHRDQRSEFTRREAQRDLRISRVEEMEGPLRLLEDNGYVRSVGVQHAARTGRKPSDAFLVNPAVWQPGSVNSVGRAL